LLRGRLLRLPPPLPGRGLAFGTGQDLLEHPDPFLGDRDDRAGDGIEIVADGGFAASRTQALFANRLYSQAHAYPITHDMPIMSTSVTRDAADG
jgi:hypothetical protein